MKLADIDKTKDYFTSKLSEVNRGLCFAGIAVIWIFVQTDNSGNIIFPEQLRTPLLAFMGALAADVIHYFYGSIAWSIYHRSKDKPGIRDRDFIYPKPINWPTNIFFYAKVLLTIYGYKVLFDAVWMKVV